MKLKTYLAATTAAFMSAPAFAADLPVVAEPVEYVAVCDAYGAGYFQLPGKNTCISVGGRIRTWYQSHDLTKSAGVTKKGTPAEYRFYDKVTGEAKGTGVITADFGAKDDIAAWNGTGTKAKRDEVKAALTAELERRDAGTVGADAEDMFADKAAKDAATKAVKDELDKFDNAAEQVTKKAKDAERNDAKFRTRGYLTLQSMTQTELMSIKTYMQLKADWGENGTGKVGVYNTYVQLGFDKVDLLFGRYASLFAPFAGYTLGYNGMPVAGDSALQARATFEMMDGFTAAFGVEASSYSTGPDNGLDFTGALNFTTGMVSTGLMGVAHAYDEDNYGYGVSAFVELTPTEKLSVGVGATYVQDALYYLDAGFNNSEFEDGSGVTGYAFYAGIGYDVTEKLNLALDGAYEMLDQNGVEYDATGVNATLTYKPVSGLSLSLDGGMWQDSLDKESAKVTGRLQYTF